MGVWFLVSVITKVLLSFCFTGLSVKMNFSIAVTDSNDAPTGIVVSGPQKLSEDSAVGTYVATLATTDQDVRQTHTYSIIEVAASNQYGARLVRRTSCYHAYSGCPWVLGVGNGGRGGGVGVIGETHKD